MTGKPYAERLNDAKAIYTAGLKRVLETPMPIGQKYPRKTFVWIAKNLGESMSHFENNRAAFVEYTYAHAYGGRNTDSYSLIVRHEGGIWSSVAWYYEHQIIEITDQAAIEEYKNEIRNQGKYEI